MGWLFRRIIKLSQHLFRVRIRLITFKQIFCKLRPRQHVQRVRIGNAIHLIFDSYNINRIRIHGFRCRRIGRCRTFFYFNNFVLRWIDFSRIGVFPVKIDSCDNDHRYQHANQADRKHSNQSFPVFLVFPFGGYKKKVKRLPSISKENTIFGRIL